MTRAGFPIAMQKSGTLSVTTLPIEIIEFSPIVTPDFIIEPGYMIAPDLMTTGQSC
jgi:hypothetical protein